MACLTSSTQDDVLAVSLSFSVHLLCVLRGKCKGGSGSNSHLACVDEVKHAILDDLGVCLNVLKLGLEQTCHHSVWHVAHTTAAAGFFAWRGRPDSLDMGDLNSPVYQYRQSIEKSMGVLFVLVCLLLCPVLRRCQETWPP